MGRCIPLGRDENLHLPTIICHSERPVLRSSRTTTAEGESEESHNYILENPIGDSSVALLLQNDN